MVDGEKREVDRLLGCWGRRDERKGHSDPRHPSLDTREWDKNPPRPLDTPPRRG